ncbi:MAG: hypothetical protein JXB47_04535 [Anaerolineae bacterium]|nr:hypothetical protein [Anaerolineae bacterium]
MFDEDASFERDAQKRRNVRSGRLRARCPECETPINLKDSVEQWDVVSCPVCGTALEVVQLRPPKLDYADGAWDYQEWEDEDWEDY